MDRYTALGQFYGTTTSTIVDVGFAVILLLIAFAAPLPDWAFAAKPAKWLRDLAGKPGRCIVVIGVSAPALRLLLLPLLPIPQPFYHDEFSYLLAADTFSSGRLANPTHPMWIHFESFHISHMPTYMSMHFPAQGMVLALGKILFGHPWFGVVMSVGVMCGAICWMLQGWLSPGWALLGGFLVVMRLGVMGYWMNTYWGGAVPAIGGALLLGALPRLLRRPGFGAGLALGLGIAILECSRPVEGLLLCVPVAFALLGWVCGKSANARPQFRVFLTSAVLPVALVLILSSGGLAYYDWRVYGHPTTLPYQTNRAFYAVSPVFLWQTPRPEPAYHHRVFHDFYVGWELRLFNRARTIPGFLEGVLRRIFTIPFFFFGPVLSIPLLMLPRVVRDPRARFLLLTAAVFFLGILGNAFFAPHYLAPVTGLFYALLLLSMDHLRSWRPAGSFLVNALPVLAVVLFGAHLASVAAAPRTDSPRVRVQHALDALPGPQLAIVRYAPKGDPIYDWVYNAADIDSAKVVWAREMGPALDRELINYYTERTAWLVDANTTPPRISPYPR